MLRSSFFLLVLLALAALIFFSSCDKKEQAKKDEETILEYLDYMRLEGFSRTEDGIYYKLLSEGSGNNPHAGSRVTVHYTGRLLDNSIFDSSYERGQPASFSLTQVIKGWQLAIPLLKPGGEGIFLIPSELAYGSSPPAGSSIGPNAVLRFDVRLISID